MELETGVCPKHPSLICLAYVHPRTFPLPHPRSKFHAANLAPQHLSALFSLPLSLTLKEHLSRIEEPDLSKNALDGPLRIVNRSSQSLWSLYLT